MAAENDVKNALNTRDFSKVIISLENCLIPIEKLTPTPSEQDGLDKDVELDLRILGCELIQTSGILLKLPQVAMASAQVLFQRFYYSKSFVKHNVEIVAMACVNLASKIEEAPRRMRDVINVFNHVKQVKCGKIIKPLVLDTNYVETKNNVIKAERRILKELGFCVHVKHPHKIVVMYLQVLECERNQALVQSAWNYMNDSFRTDAFVRFNPETIACACIYLAARQLQLCLPMSPPWFSLFDAHEDDLKDISLEILQLYQRSKPDAEKLDQIVGEIKRQQIEARLRAKSKNNPVSDTSRPNTPMKCDSPISAVERVKNADVKSEASFGHNIKKRSRSPPSVDSRASKSRSRSRSRSASESNSPVRKRAKSPHRRQKENSRAERRREKQRERNSYDYNNDRDRDRHSNSKKKRSKDQDSYDDYYYDARDYKQRKHSSMKAVENRATAAARSDSYSPAEAQAPPPSRTSSKKKYYKEKRRSRTRSRSYDRHDSSKRKSKKHANGHHHRSRGSRSPERYRR